MHKVSDFQLQKSCSPPQHEVARRQKPRAIGRRRGARWVAALPATQLMQKRNTLHVIVWECDGRAGNQTGDQRKGRSVHSALMCSAVKDPPAP